MSLLCLSVKAIKSREIFVDHNPFVDSYGFVIGRFESQDRNAILRLQAQPWRSSPLLHNPSPVSRDDTTTVHNAQAEHFVAADVAAAFLSITHKYLLKLSRLGLVPAHPIGIGSRKQWRYRISELAEWALAQRAAGPDNVSGSPRASKGRR